MFPQIREAIMLSVNDYPKNLSLSGVKEDCLIKMFYELRIERVEEKKLMFSILKILVSRNKLYLLNRGNKSTEKR
jgi:hypothetical protein